MLNPDQLHRQCKITARDLFDDAHSFLIESQMQFNTNDVLRLCEIMQKDFKIMMEDSWKEMNRSKGFEND